MKKLFFCFALLLLPLLFAGCNGQTLGVEESMSEITNVYFQGFNGNDRASISVGLREEPYILNGYHGQDCEFSLIVLSISDNMEENVLNATLTINGEESQVELEFNPLANAYMQDLGYNLQPDDQVSLTYGNKIINFSNVSQDFAVSSEEAIDIAKMKLIDEISDLTNNGNFEGECYLKVLGESGSDFRQLFWAFSIVSRDGQTYNVIISASDGSVLAGD